MVSFAWCWDTKTEFMSAICKYSTSYKHDYIIEDSNITSSLLNMDKVSSVVYQDMALTSLW